MVDNKDYTQSTFQDSTSQLFYDSDILDRKIEDSYCDLFDDLTNQTQELSTNNLDQSLIDDIISDYIPTQIIHALFENKTNTEQDNSYQSYKQNTLLAALSDSVINYSQEDSNLQSIDILIRVSEILDNYNSNLSAEVQTSLVSLAYNLENPDFQDNFEDPELPSVEQLLVDSKFYVDYSEFEIEITTEDPILNAPTLPPVQPQTAKTQLSYTNYAAQTEAENQEVFALVDDQLAKPLSNDIIPFTYSETVNELTVKEVTSVDTYEGSITEDTYEAPTVKINPQQRVRELATDYSQRTLVEIELEPTVNENSIPLFSLAYLALPHMGENNLFLTLYEHPNIFKNSAYIDGARSTLENHFTEVQLIETPNYLKDQDTRTTWRMQEEHIFNTGAYQLLRNSDKRFRYLLPIESLVDEQPATLTNALDKKIDQWLEQNNEPKPVSYYSKPLILKSTVFTTDPKPSRTSRFTSFVSSASAFAFSAASSLTEILSRTQ